MQKEKGGDHSKGSSEKSQQQAFAGDEAGDAKA
jgi:hypothetical protein